MWSIVWNIENKVKYDVLWFATEAQALKYAQYYKSLLEVHDAGQHMQKRFGNHEDKSESLCLKISFRLMKKKSASNISALESQL